MTQLAVRSGAPAAAASRQRHTASRQRHTASRQRHTAARIALAGLVGVSVAAAIVFPSRVGGVVSAVVTWLAGAISALTWPMMACLVVVSAAHYIAAAVSTRAAAGVPLPFGELVAAQYAATAANRLTPVGLGGATMVGRFLVRRGRLQPAQALAAVSAVAVLGVAADVLAFALLIGVGTALGVSGASGEVPLLASKLTALAPAAGVVWAIVGAIALTLAAVAATSRARRFAARIAPAVRTYANSLAALIVRPRRVATLMAASASTTVLLAVGFAGAATLGRAGLPLRLFGALMIGYMVAAAAGNALPAPGGIGTADAAFVGVLVAAGLPVAHALSAVLAFRLMTSWAPAAVGALLVRPLRRRGAL